MTTLGQLAKIVRSIDQIVHINMSWLLASLNNASYLWINLVRFIWWSNVNPSICPYVGVINFNSLNLYICLANQHILFVIDYTCGEHLFIKIYLPTYTFMLSKFLFFCLCHFPNWSYSFPSTNRMSRFLLQLFSELWMHKKCFFYCIKLLVWITRDLGFFSWMQHFDRFILSLS